MKRIPVNRVSLQEEAWKRAGRLLYKAEATGDHPVKPSSIIRQAEKGEDA